MHNFYRLRTWKLKKNHFHKSGLVVRILKNLNSCYISESGNVPKNYSLGIMKMSTKIKFENLNNFHQPWAPAILYQNLKFKIFLNMWNPLLTNEVTHFIEFLVFGINQKALLMLTTRGLNNRLSSIYMTSHVDVLP